MKQEAGEGFSLSPQQRRLWALLTDQDRRAYTVRAVIEVKGGTSIEALRQAWIKLVERHEILRTRFVRLKGMAVPFQVVGGVELTWSEPVVLDDRESESGEARVEAFFQGMGTVDFDLENGPQVRVLPLVLSSEKHLMLCAMPGLCADHMSLDLLVDELASCYGEVSAGIESAVAEDEMQYIDLAEMQNDLLEEGSEERDFWRDEGLWSSAWMQLPGGQHEPELAAFEPRFLSFFLTPRVIAAAAAQGVSVRVFLLTCWQILLARLGDRQDLSVGVAFNGRRYEELETALGLFERYLPLRVRLTADLPFSKLLKVTARNWEQAEEAQEVFAFDEIADLVEEGEKALFFPFCFDFAALRMTSASAPPEGPHFSILRRSVCVDGFHLRLSCRRHGDELAADLCYDARRLPGDTVGRLASQLSTLVLNAATAPGTHVGNLAILGQVEHHQVVFEYNDTSRLSCLPELFHRRFEQQTRNAPSNSALVFEEESATYDELNRRANRLAHHLRRHQVGTDDLVAICLERSLDSIVAMLATLKAGGAYAILDPTQPAPRLASMLEEMNMPLMVTRTSLIEGLVQRPPRWICLDRDCQIVAAELETDLGDLPEAAGLAYVLFTSGSSGRPKGVAVENRQLLDYIDGVLERLIPSPGASFATVSTLAADLGHTAIFPALATGGCLHLVSLERSTQPTALADYFKQHEIDYLKIVPSHLSALLDSPRGSEIFPRKGLVVGGELFRRELGEQLRELAADRLVLNHYGPTETTVGVLTCRLSDDLRGASVPLGRPMRNVRVHLLNAGFMPVGAGEPGELTIGGSGLSRGYLRRPGQTAAVFVPDPWGAEPGSRLYRSGDRARRLPDGRLEYLDRIDHQVKIRGFRIELGELEAILGAHPQVRQAVVVTRSDVAGSPFLVAYVVAPGSEAGDLSQGLREWARQRLPPYMVPTDFVVLGALPLNPNGKVDRQALPAPRQRVDTGQVHAVPENPLEEILTNLWAQLLKVERVGVDEDFVELGGHSLLAMQLVTRVREICGVEIPLGEFLAAPTVAGLAARVERMRLGRSAGLPPIAVIESDGDAPLSFSQQRYWRWRHPKPNTVSRNDLTAFHFVGPLEVGLFRRAMGMIVDRHQVLRTSYAEQDGQPAQVIHRRLEVGIPMVDLSTCDAASRDAEVRRVVDFEDAKLFDLERAPLFRLRLFRLASDEHLFLFVVHHIAVDGWSIAVLKKDLITFYKALREGLGSPLADLPIQYKDFAIWQQQHLAGEVWDHQLEYWRENLDGVVPSPDLPTDRPRSTSSSYRGAFEPLEFPEHLTQKLEEVSRRQSVTLFVTLLASFKTLLYHYTGESELSVVSPFANRNRPEIENMVGCFMNVLPLRTHMSGIETFPQLLAQVRETTLGAYSHPDIPFDRLVRDVVLPQLPEKIHELFVFRILFALGGAPELIPDLPDLKISFLPVKSDRMYNDILILLRQIDGKLVGKIKFNTDLFDASRIATLCRNYIEVLEAVAEDPERPLAALWPKRV